MTPKGGAAVAPNTIPLLIIGGVIIVLLLAWLAVRALLRRDDEEELPDYEPEDPPAVPVAPVRPAPAPVTPPPPPPARPVTPPEPSIYTYPGLRGGWWVCPNCACENEPERTRCSVCLWDRSVGVS